jgi:hypothetical protein
MKEILNKLMEKFKAKKEFNLEISKKNDLDEFIEEQQDVIIGRCRKLETIPKDIALNVPFKENIFSLFICIFSRIPLFICGKPGSSKSISLKIIKDSFASQKVIGGEDQFLNGFPMIYIFQYQGSKQSKEEGIVKIFNKAARKCDFNKIGLMLFDEIGIAELSPNKPLKVLHEYLNKSKLDDKDYGGGTLKLIHIT